MFDMSSFVFFQEATIVSEGENSSRIKYDREYLLSLRQKCKALPPHLEAATLSALAPPPGSRNDGMYRFVLSLKVILE